MVKSTEKDIGQSQQKFDIPKVKAYDTKEIFPYVHLTENMLFDGQSISQPDKTALVTELEKTLNKVEYIFEKESPLKSVTVN